MSNDHDKSKLPRAAVREPRTGFATPQWKQGDKYLEVKIPKEPQRVEPKI